MENIHKLENVLFEFFGFFLFYDSSILCQHWLCVGQLAAYDIMISCSVVYFVCALYGVLNMRIAAFPPHTKNETEKMKTDKARNKTNGWNGCLTTFKSFRLIIQVDCNEILSAFYWFFFSLVFYSHFKAERAMKIKVKKKKWIRKNRKNKLNVNKVCLPFTHH